jgi:hypothetical protein
MVGVGRKSSVLITISHREDASPCGQRQTACPSHDKRIGLCQITNPYCEGLRPCSPLLGWRVIAENGQTLCQKRDDASDRRRPSLHGLRMRQRRLSAKS